MSAALSWLGPWCWQYLSVYLYKGIWIQFCEIFCNYTFIIIYFQSCQKKKIKHNNRWIFQCLVYKHVIYESRFNLVCSNISYKPLNLNLFGPDIFSLQRIQLDCNISKINIYNTLPIHVSQGVQNLHQCLLMYINLGISLTSRFLNWLKFSLLPQWVQILTKFDCERIRKCVLYILYLDIYPRW